MENLYDMLIVGGGPGGYTAALYAARAGLQVALVEQLSAGGQMATTEQVDNYPGFDEGVDGFVLAQKMQNGAERFGAKTIYAAVTGLDLRAEPKRIETTEGQLLARTVVLAMGASPRLLGVPGETELRGRGVSYCATCDGMFYRGKTVVVAGGGNSAAADALVLSRLCRTVYVLHRRDTLRADRVYLEPLKQAGNIQFIWNAQIERLEGGMRLSAVQYRDKQSGLLHTLACDGLFVAIGRAPETGLVRGQLALDEQGYIPAPESTRTEIPGVYAVGDLRAKPLRQIVTACADGAVAAQAAEQDLFAAPGEGKSV